MKGLDENARIIVEKNIDSVINEPEQTEKAFRNTLREQGIEPNLETVLSSISGYIEGIVDGFYYHEYNRLMNDDERKELTQLLKRRAFEIRQTFVSTRIEE